MVEWNLPEATSKTLSAGGKISMVHRFLSLIGIIYLCIATFSVQTDKIQPGLDESWRYGLNALATGHYIFGKDVIFTYGPLGYLSHPMPLGDNLARAAAFTLCIQAVFAVS